VGPCRDQGHEPGSYHIEWKHEASSVIVQENFEVASGERAGLDTQPQLGQIN
jgi:hypothetical protein